jgi:hypothetical protein
MQTHRCTIQNKFSRGIKHIHDNSIRPCSPPIRNPNAFQQTKIIVTVCGYVNIRQPLLDKYHACLARHRLKRCKTDKRLAYFDNEIFETMKKQFNSRYRLKFWYHTARRNAKKCTYTPIHTYKGIHPIGGAPPTNAMKARRATKQNKLNNNSSANVQKHRSHYIHPDFKRYKNHIPTLTENIDVAQIMLETSAGPSDTAHAEHRLRLLNKQLLMAKKHAARTEEQRKRMEKLRQRQLDNAELPPNLEQSDEEEDDDDNNSEHGFQIANKTLVMTAEWFDDTVAKFLADYLSTEVDEDITDARKLQIKQDIEQKVKHIVLTRRAGGPLLNNAMYKVQAHRQFVHSEIQKDVNVNTDDEKENFCQQQYGSTRYHEKHQDLQTVDKSKMKYFTHIEFKQIQAGHLIEDDIPVTDEDTGQKRLFRQCDDTCTIPDKWGWRVHAMLDVFQPKEDNFIEMLQTERKFGHCDNCYDVGYTECPLDTCTDNIRFLRHLMPHFGRIRSLMKDLYAIKGLALKLNSINQCLLHCRYSELIEAIDEVDFNLAPDGARISQEKLDQRSAQHSQQAVKAKWGAAIERFRADIGPKFFPIHVCKVCHRMRANTQMLRKQKTFAFISLNYGDIGKAIVQLIKTENPGYEPDIYMLCKDCWKSIRFEILPSFCSLNQFFLFPLPPVIGELTHYELMLITPVRSIKKIIQLKTRTTKVLNFNRMRAVRGTAIHLPMPTEGAMEHIINELPSMHRMQFLMNAIPNEAQKIINQHLIDFDKVLLALDWLIRNNHLYQRVHKISNKTVLMKQLELACDQLDLPDAQLYADMPDQPEGTNVQRLNAHTVAELTEHYSMQPVQMTNALRNSMADVFQHQKVAVEAVQSHNTLVDVLSYPSIYPTGQFGLKDARRTVPITINAYYNALLCQLDPRARLNIDFLMDAMLRKEQQSIGHGIWRLRQTGQFKHMKVASLQDCIAKKDSDFNYNVNEIQTHNRGSAAYMNSLYKINLTYDQAFGPATFFLTLSIAEYSWKDLEVYLRFMNRHRDDIDTIPLSRLCLMDPVSVCKHFQKRFDAIMAELIAPGKYKSCKIIETPEGIFGYCDHYFYRVEFQARGAQHIHMKIWIRNAPNIETHTKQEVIDWISSIITCRLPDEIMEKELYDLVNKYQTHKCRELYCVKHGKGKSGKFNTYCKFGFGKAGRPIVTEPRLLPMEVVLRSKRKNPRKYAQILRTSAERFINDYNAPILLAWRANMDIQYIGEPSCVLNHYITGYITKAEQGVAADILDNIDRSGKSVTSILKSVTNQFIKSREIGANESCIKLTGLPYAGYDTPVNTVSLGTDDERHAKLRPKAFLDDPKNKNKSVICVNLVNNYYPNRPIGLSDISLYDAKTKWKVMYIRPARFADPDDTFDPEICPLIKNNNNDEDAIDPDANDDPEANELPFEIEDAQPEPDDTGDQCYKFTYPFDGYNSHAYFVKLKKEALLKYNTVRTKTEQDHLRYYYNALQLHKPWRSEYDLKGDFDTLHEAFCAAMKDLPKLRGIHDHKLFIESELKKAHKWEADALENIDDADEDYFRDDEIIDLEPVADRVERLRQMFTANLEERPHEELAATLNETQLRVYNNVMNPINHFHEKHANGACDCAEPVLPVRRFVSGVAGTGKSHLINTIVATLHQKYTGGPDGFPAVAVVAPTGLSAFNVNGVTMHKMFKLPVQHGGDEPKLYDLSQTDIKIMCEVLKNVRLIIIDECSMISNISWAKIERRLSALFPIKSDANPSDNSQLFGGRSILLFGDLLQLGPVSKVSTTPFIFSKFRRNDKIIQRVLGLSGMPDLWIHIIYEELLENMRQKDDPAFLAMLNNIRIGCPTMEDIDALFKRQIDCDPDKIEEVVRIFHEHFLKDKNTLALYGQTKDVDTFNSLMLQREKIDIVVIKARDTAKRTRDNNDDEPKKKKTKKNTISSKASETGGLVTLLTVGVNARIMLRRNLDTRIGLVNGAMGSIIKLNFEHSSTEVLSLLVKFDTITDPQLITRFEADFESQSSVFTIREQFPVILAYAITIHKCQGLTLPKVFVEMGKNIHSKSMAYVALSRTRKLEDLYLIGFNPILIECDKLCVAEYNRLRQTFNVMHKDLQQLPMFEKTNILPPKYQLMRRQKYAHLFPPKEIELVDPTTKPKGTKPRTTKPPKGRQATATTDEQRPALVFSNPIPESCYANAGTQLLLASNVFTQFMRTTQQIQHLNVTKEFCALATLNDNPPRKSVSVDRLRSAVGEDYRRGTGFQASEQYISTLLEHYSDHANLWQVTDQIEKYYSCCNRTSISYMTHSSLAFDDFRPVHGTMHWNTFIGGRHPVEITYDQTYCEECYPTEMLKPWKKIHGRQFESWMKKHHGVRMKQTVRRSVHADNRLLIIDIPRVKRQTAPNGTIENITLNGHITHLPESNNYQFKALPGMSFTLRSLICFRNAHYWSYALKGNDWYKLNCLPFLEDPHPALKVDRIPPGIHEVCLMLLERNIEQN